MKPIHKRLAAREELETLPLCNSTPTAPALDDASLTHDDALVTCRSCLRGIRAARKAEPTKVAGTNGQI